MPNRYTKSYFDDLSHLELEDLEGVEIDENYRDEYYDIVEEAYVKYGKGHLLWPLKYYDKYKPLFDRLWEYYYSYYPFDRKIREAVAWCKENNILAEYLELASIDDVKKLCKDFFKAKDICDTGKSNIKWAIKEGNLRFEGEVCVDSLERVAQIIGLIKR